MCNDILYSTFKVRNADIFYYYNINILLLIFSKEGDILKNQRDA